MDENIEKKVSEIRNWIVATKNGKRRIRSGSFWNKFGFERRTSERVETVKKSLAKHKIEINLDPDYFGTEKRGETIILRLTDYQKAQNLYAERSEIDFENVSQKLDTIAATRERHYDIQYLFSMLFAELFWNETPNYKLPSGDYGATRSNWTYHTAGAISQACKILNLTCKFEAGGKRDAIIETGEKPEEVVLAAEWEWNYNDIFGSGKELDKLRSSCQQFVNADAFLLVYCPANYFLEYLAKIASEWFDIPVNTEQKPALFLHTVIFEESNQTRVFDRLKTVMIQDGIVEIWGDKYIEEELGEAEFE